MITEFFSKNPILAILLLVIVTYVLSKRVEKFTNIDLLGKTIVTEEEYIQEIRVLSSYVGPYISEIYSYLRAKYFNPEKNITLPPNFQPAGITDPTLSDPLLPIARAQIKGWIDSAKLRMETKFPREIKFKMATRFDVRYQETPEKVLKVTHVDNGKETVYLV